MRLVGFDTATPVTAVAVLDTDAGIELSRIDAPDPGCRPNHATALLTLLDEVLAEAALSWGAVDRIAVGIGPGTFTGLRIGLATAHGLAGAARIELVPVSSLAALAVGAAGAGAAAGRPVLACIDARRGEAFIGGPGAAPAAVAPDRLGPAAAGRLVVGDGALRFRDVLEAGGAEVPAGTDPVHRPDALWHCRLAVGLEPRPVAQVRPDYVRAPDATP